MLSSASTEARELQFRLDNRLGYDSNVFGRPNRGAGLDSPGDGVYEISPRVVLLESNKNINYDFRYQPVFEQIFGTKRSTSGINGVDHSARSRVDWQITPVDAIGASGSYSNSRRLRLSTEDISLGSDADFVPSDRERLSRSLANFYYRKAFTSKFSSRIEYNFDDRGSSRNAFSDSRAHSGSIRGDYVLNALTTVGMSGTGRFRKGKINQFVIPGSGGFLFPRPREIRSSTVTYDVSFSIQRALSRTVNLSIQVGPSWVNSEQDVNDRPGRTKDRTVSVFAAANATKSWRNGAFSAGYTRSESAGGGTSTASIVDQITLNVRHRFTEKWTARSIAGWSRREVIADSAILGNDSRVESWTFVSTLDRRFTKNWLATVRLRYRLQNEERVSSNRETETISGFFSITYTFDPIVF